MAVAIKVEQQLSKQMFDALQKLQNLQLKKPLEAIGKEVVSQTEERITNEQSAPDGTPWAGWSGSYKEYKAKKQDGGAFLDASGALIDSLDYQATSDEVLVGSNLVYAATHQFGDESRNIEARPFLGISQQNEKELLKVMNDAINRELQRMGFN